MYNSNMFRLVQQALHSLDSSEKVAFVPPDQIGASAGMPADPNMGGGGAPMDPAMMGGMDPAMGGGMPMDPAMMGMDPAAMGMDPAAMGGMPMDPSMMDPAMMGMDPAAMGMAPDGFPEVPTEEVDEEDVEDKIKKVLTETGVIKPPKVNPAEQFGWIVDSIKKLGKAMGVELDSAPDGFSKSEKDPAAAGGAGLMAAGGLPPVGQASSLSLGSLGATPVTTDGMPGAMKAASTASVADKISLAMSRLRNGR